MNRGGVKDRGEKFQSTFENTAPVQIAGMCKKNKNLGTCRSRNLQKLQITDPKKKKRESPNFRPAVEVPKGTKNWGT